jgi:hypothetical protein
VSKDHGLSSPRAVGLAGSALIAIGGLGAGALPVGIPYLPGGHHARLGLVGVYTGLALLLLAWWWYGRVTRGDHADGSCRTARWTLALWVAPLLLAPPLFSRDVYSYLAQGLMIDSGMDVYRHGPSVLGGMVAAQVPAIWQHTPSPYGPVFLIVAEVVAGPLSSHLLLGVLAMRLVAIAGLALLAGSVPILARSTGVRPSSATWLAVLNPLVLIHLVDGAHNVGPGATGRGGRAPPGARPARRALRRAGAGGAAGRFWGGRRTRPAGGPRRADRHSGIPARTPRRRPRNPAPDPPMIVPERLRSGPAQVALVVGTAIAIGVFLTTALTFRHFFDLGVYRGSVRYWLIDGGHLYDYRYQHSAYGFTYPPFAALSWPR